MDRNEKFGRLLAIANVLSHRLYERDKLSVSDKHLARYPRHPRKSVEMIHRELMEYSHRFGENEIRLLDQFSEIMASIEISEFTNDPLEYTYLHAYYTQQHALDSVVGAEEAAAMWKLTPGYIKNLCAAGRLKAKKIGKTWVIDKNQPRPNTEE